MQCFVYTVVNNKQEFLLDVRVSVSINCYLEFDEFGGRGSVFCNPRACCDLVAAVVVDISDNARASNRRYARRLVSDAFACRGTCVVEFCSCVVSLFSFLVKA